MSLSRTHVVALVSLGAGLGLGILLAVTRFDAPRSDRAGATPTPALLSVEDQRRIGEVLARIQADYVDEVDAPELVDAALRGMLAGLDDYSMYLDTPAYDEILENSSGSYPGVGIEVAAERDGIRIVRPLEDSPAARAGLEEGDLIVQIDGRPVDADVDAAIEQMRGPPGTPIQLTLRRRGAPEPVEVALERSRVDLRSVRSALLSDRVGYLRITAFDDTTGTDAEAAVLSLRAAAPAGLAGLILDLRDNPGGVLEAAVETADLFLERGIIVTATGRTADSRFQMEATSGDILEGARLVVLVNANSASAAEILAGALRDHRRATLVGRRTFGKGSVQTIMPLTDGRALKLTTSVYSTPSGARIDRQGIDPDVSTRGGQELPAEFDASPRALLSRDGDVRAAVRLLQTRIAWK